MTFITTDELLMGFRVISGFLTARISKVTESKVSIWPGKLSMTERLEFLMARLKFVREGKEDDSCFPIHSSSGREA